MKLQCKWKGRRRHRREYKVRRERGQSEEVKVKESGKEYTVTLRNRETQ